MGRKQGGGFLEGSQGIQGNLGGQTSFKKESNRSAVIQHIQNGPNVEGETYHSSVQSAVGNYLQKHAQCSDVHRERAGGTPTDTPES